MNSLHYIESFQRCPIQERKSTLHFHHVAATREGEDPEARVRLEEQIFRDPALLNTVRWLHPGRRRFDELRSRVHN